MSSVLWKIDRYHDVPYVMLSTKTKSPLKGVSLTSTESIDPCYLFYDSSFSKSDVIQTVTNIAQTLWKNWGCTLVRIPLCMSQYWNNPLVSSFSDDADVTYQDWIALLVSIFNTNGQVVILDGHLWSPVNSDGTWGQTCPDNSVAPNDITSIMNDKRLHTYLMDTWRLIGKQYQNHQNVFFEVFNEPRFDGWVADDQLDWEQWQTLMLDLTSAIRENATTQVVIIGGLSWAYDFLPSPTNSIFQQKFGSSYDNLFQPFVKKGPVAFNIHPYQHASCCGQVTNEDRTIDLSQDDKYFQTYCTFYKDGQATDYDSWRQLSTSFEHTYLYPKDTMCTGNGLSSTDPKKMPPCQWKAIDIINGQKGFCSGDSSICLPYTNQNDCDHNKTPAGWDRNLIVQQYGPMIMTEFGSYDCSTPYVKDLLEYAEKHGIAWTAWALWPQNNGGPGTAGACGYPSIIMNNTDNNLKGCKPSSTNRRTRPKQVNQCQPYQECQDACQGTTPSQCDDVLKPLGFYGKLIQSFMITNQKESTQTKEHYTNTKSDRNKDDHGDSCNSCTWMYYVLVIFIAVMILIFILASCMMSRTTRQRQKKH